MHSAYAIPVDAEPEDNGFLFVQYDLFPYSVRLFDLYDTLFWGNNENIDRWGESGELKLAYYCFQSHWREEATVDFCSF